jgi:hypothetical protein
LGQPLLTLGPQPALLNALANLPHSVHKTLQQDSPVLGQVNLPPPAAASCCTAFSLYTYPLGSTCVYIRQHSCRCPSASGQTSLIYCAASLTHGNCSPTLATPQTTLVAASIGRAGILTKGGLCSSMISLVTAHTSLECTCLAKGRPCASVRKAGRCRGSSREQLSCRLCGVLSADSPACRHGQHTGLGCSELLPRSWCSRRGAWQVGWACLSAQQVVHRSVLFKQHSSRLAAGYCSCHLEVLAGPKWQALLPTCRCTDSSETGVSECSLYSSLWNRSTSSLHCTRGDCAAFQACLGQLKSGWLSCRQLPDPSIPNRQATWHRN